MAHEKTNASFSGNTGLTAEGKEVVSYVGEEGEGSEVPRSPCEMELTKNK